MAWCRLNVFPFLALCCAVACYLLSHVSYDLESIRGKRVLVTGASTGIGEQLAYRYAKLGANVFITARRAKQLAEVTETCRQYGESSNIYGFIPADMANNRSYQTVIQQAVQTMGGLDILILNHILPTPLGEWNGTDQDFASLRQIMDVNFYSYVQLASYALPYLEQSNGSILVMSSVAGKISMPYSCAYSSSKFALEGFFNSLRQQLVMAHSGVSITLAVLGFIDTENARVNLEKAKLTKISQNFASAPAASDAAVAVVNGCAARLREMYFPYMMARSTVLARDFFIVPLEIITRRLYSKDEN